MRPLEPSADEMTTLVARATERIVELLTTLDAQSAGDVGRGAGAGLDELDEPIPERGAPYDDLLAQLFERVIPTGINTAGPGHLSYVPNGGLFHAAVADLIALSANRYVGYWAPAPGLVQLELTVVRWMCELLGLPGGSGGLLTSGGSIAGWIALTTARRARLPEDFLAGTIYASDQVHHSVAKGAMLAGFPPGRVREVASDASFRMRPDALREAVLRDRRAGATPFLVVATAGTTNTGAVDDVGAIADVAAELGLWLHVDACYGGFFVLTERGRRVLAGIERADSVALDPHKSLFLPFGTGALLVRDLEVLRRAHLVHSDYIGQVVETGEAAQAINFADLGPELSRECRGLRVWLPMKLLGAAAFRDALDEKLDLAMWATERLAAMPSVEILASPQLSTVAFRVVRAGASEEALDALNQRVLAGVVRRGRAHLSPTILAGRVALRICVLSFRTHAVHVEACIEDLRASIAEILVERADS